MSERETLPADVVELLSAIAQALELPVPSVARADEREHARLLDSRATDVLVTLSALLRYPDYPTLQVDAAYLRKRTADTPVTYTPYRFGEQGGEG
ncbi:hypothetical protein [Streptomyces cinereoruber]|uniref:hypothetical protein n=1 Tax=Streptomyces cinereoruber TaxID=67260 RepID=UPI00364219F3